MTITIQTQVKNMNNITKLANKGKNLKGKYLSLHKLVPNMITMTALASGMTSIKFAIAEKWELAVVAVIIAACMDAFDGAAARLLNAQSKLGAELDSLSDFMCFGVAPAFTIYLWTNSAVRFGWVTALIFAMACALRLARFNIAQDEQDKSNPLNKYFTGVPAPVGAALAFFPMVLSFQIDNATNPLFIKYLSIPQVTYVWMIIVAAMMVSRIPTVSTKQIKIHNKMAVPALAVFGIVLAGLINETWPTLTIIGICYLFFMPFGVYLYNKKAQGLTVGSSDTEEDADDSDDTEDDEETVTAK